MNPAKTAQKAQHSGKNASPFDQITQQESQENERAEKEIASLEKEKQEVIASLQKKEDGAHEEYKQQAKKELKLYSETELAEIITDAKKEVNQQDKTLQEQYEKLEASVAKDLVQKANDPDFLLAA